MNNAQYWIDHYKPVDPKLQDRFLKLTPDDCKEILGGLDISSTKGISYESSENRVFGFDNVVIKFYRPGRWSLEALKEEILFLEDLRKANVSFVRPIGGVGTSRGLYYIVFEKLSEASFINRKVLDEDSVRKMVHLTARLHDVGTKRDASARAQFDPLGMTSGCFNVIKKAGFLPKSLELRYKEAADELVRKINQAGDIFVQRIHGDTYSDNILWNDDNPVFMDLDDFQIGPVALDVKLLSFPWRLDTLPESMPRRERRLIQHKMVIEMYREVRSFPKEWESLFPLLGAYRDIQLDAWFSARWSEKGFAANYQDDDITEADWWKDSIEGLEELVSG